ncbi:carbohydrate ABC transporter permease (plasmid) [Ralstonia sp. 25C]|uniref:carbohydrate ABC transporter permease n=1 Tax=Ralstonia sp. 25C TaxID=3447363 RepID=UPI003F755FD7
MKPMAPFPHRWLPLALAAPQLALAALFFYWPAAKAVWWSFHLERPFGNGSVFVGLQNYWRVLTDPGFHVSLRATLLFTAGGVGSAVVAALVLAGCANLSLRGSKLFRHLLIWPYAVAGAVLGVILRYLMSPVAGPLGWLNQVWPGLWAPHVSGNDALLMVTVAFAWTQIPFNFVIFTAALQSVPEDTLAAAAIDGAGPLRRFIDIQLPLIAPFVLLVLVVNMLESFTNSFGIIDTLTRGGPGEATEILSYKIFSDGFVGLDLSGSSTLSVVLMIGVIVLTFVQFRAFERGSGASH